MKIKIAKYHGAGNDFIIIDNRAAKIELTKEQIESLCHRRFGVGADGLIYLNRGEENYDFSMAYYNSDGLLGTMCGNGGRCLVAFAAHQGIKSYRFKASDGPHQGRVLKLSKKVSQIEIDMKEVTTIKEHSPKSLFLDTGSPHLVIFVDSLHDYDVLGQGKLWRHHPIFPGGTNVNFVQGSWGKGSQGWSRALEPGTSLELAVRTYERGVEDETLACGTGITASAIAYHSLLSKNYENRFDALSYWPIEINAKVQAEGGQLEVNFQYEGEGRYSNILLRGPAAFVFECEIEI